jgi:hypothetical protein
MAMATHSHNDACKPRTLFIVLSLSLCVITSLEAQEKTVRPDDLACPVTANLFPEQVRTTDSIKFIFSNGAIPRRISIALINPENKDISIGYRWVGNGLWGVQTGIFIANGEGKTDCFFLGSRIPENVACKEFVLSIPENIRVKEIAFSNLPSEKPIVLCPMPELEQEINEAYGACGLNPKDESKASLLIQLLEKITPRYDCRRPFDSEPVPAWWLANHEAPWRWIDYLYHKVLENNADALRVYEKFLATSDGAVAEIMSEQMWGILHDLPLFILENWTGIEDNKEWVLIARPWPSQGSVEINNMIEIYGDVARRKPKYKAACDEIISILSEKSQEAKGFLIGETLEDGD